MAKHINYAVGGAILLTNWIEIVLTAVRISVHKSLEAGIVVPTSKE